MSAAERGQKVVKRLFVCQVQRRQPQLDFVILGVKQILDSNAGVEDIPLGHAGRPQIVVLLSAGGDFPADGSCGAQGLAIDRARPAEQGQ